MDKLLEFQPTLERTIFRLRNTESTIIHVLLKEIHIQNA